MVGKHMSDEGSLRGIMAKELNSRFEVDDFEPQS